MEDGDYAFDHSLSMVKALELFPGKKSFEKDVDDLELPFEPLYGEFPEYLGVCQEGVVAASNLRLCVKGHNNASITIPLGLIDFVEVREVSYLFVLCKDARTIRFVFHR
jgi:myotubularin-related protein 3/4